MTQIQKIEYWMRRFNRARELKDELNTQIALHWSTIYLIEWFRGGWKKEYEAYEIRQTD